MMKNQPRNPVRLLLGLAICVIGWVAAPSVALAEDLLVVVAEEVASAEGASDVAFWWDGPVPQWTATDVALQEAMRGEGTGFARPKATSELSRIYRVPGLSDTSAIAMASVFSRSRVLVGRVTYVPTNISPVGLVGWRATVDLRLLEQGDSGPTVRQQVSFVRAKWASRSDESLTALRADVAEQVARSVAGGLGRKVGPVGVDAEELLIGVRSAGTTAVVDAVIGRLQTFAGVTEVGFRWAAEGEIVLEVNPGQVDPESSVRQYASLLGAEEFEDFRLSTTDTGDNAVIVFRVEEAPR